MTEKYIKDAICWIHQLQSWIRVSDINLIRDKNGDYYSNLSMVHMHTVYPYEDWMEEYIGTNRDFREDERFKTENVLTGIEKAQLSMVASDLLTGNHLLGRFRTYDQKRLMIEFCKALNDIDNGNKLTKRQVGLILEMSKMFHEGIDDMCEQLGIDPVQVKQALS